jgi:hypothetical protein
MPQHAPHVLFTAPFTAPLPALFPVLFPALVPALVVAAAVFFLIQKQWSCQPGDDAEGDDES